MIKSQDKTNQMNLKIVQQVLNSKGLSTSARVLDIVENALTVALWIGYEEWVEDSTYNSTFRSAIQEILVKSN